MITIEFSGSITVTGTIEDFLNNFACNHATIADYVAETDCDDVTITKITAISDDNDFLSS